jgi:hypothetical protein
MSDGERACRQVIAWVRDREATPSPDGSEELACRLEAELQDHLGRHGDVRLPDPQW